MERRFVTIDGNEAAATIAHQCNEVIAIYPITPASAMGELADAWSAAGRTNIFGTVPEVIEMQSEAGAAGAVHGALQGGALATTFTASQGLLLMLPNMFKIAGELTPAVFHVAARTVATHALSIFGDHSDVMAARTTGWAMLASGDVQEAHDFALIAQAATLESRVPFLHFFDGFRTSHEVSKIASLGTEDIRAMIDERGIEAHRNRSLSPDRPTLRGSAQNPDVFFQAREAINPYYVALPGIVQKVMDRFSGLVGRSYRVFDYVGAPEAERVVVVIGSASGAIEEVVEALVDRGEKVGMIKVRLFRPFDAASFVAALPPTTRAIAVLDRTKEPGAIGEPLYQDVVTALVEGWAARVGASVPMPRVIGGRYGLASKEFTPGMAAAVFAELDAAEPRRHFTVGIVDDVTHLSLKDDPSFSTEADDILRAVFYGLGSDGTVGANKNSVKIVGENTPLFTQGYFVYDSKKSGSTTVSHLRFSPRPIRSSYLIRRANFVACHQWGLLERSDVLETAEPGATFLLNSSYGPEQVWSRLPSHIQRGIIDKKLGFSVVDAMKVAGEAGLGGRINTVMQVCFFALAGILPREVAIEQIKKAISKTYGRRGEAVLERNFAAVDGALAALHEVAVPAAIDGPARWIPPIPETEPDFVRRITRMMIEGQGDLLPVSAMPVDGTFPTGTARFEKRSIAVEIPIWDPAICIQCGLCAMVCPHAAIRSKAYAASALDSAPGGFPSRPWTGKELPDHHVTIQVAPDDCTGCGICVDVCPAVSKSAAKHKAINMEPKAAHLDVERGRWDFFLRIPDLDRTRPKIDTVKGSQLLQPLFEFSGACAGCGETPYLKLMSQLFGERAIIANATGCSSIYGGNLPTTPWAANAKGRGPAWANSLFEDNAEFGLGIRMAVDQQQEYARHLLRELAEGVGHELVKAILSNPQENEARLIEQRERVAELKTRLAGMNGSPDVHRLAAVADALVRRSVWIVGGDGWAYDIGFGGLDHVLASGHDVNILVLDTEVYSNTGGQASKATPRAAVAKFASGGKATAKKDLGMIAVDYGNVYVAQVAMGANPLQTLKVFEEADSFRGPSLILAYSHCIAHGCEMSTAMGHQKEAVASAYWPLYRYDPRLGGNGRHPFHLDSRAPTLPVKEFALKEARYAMLARANPEQAEQLLALAQRDVDERWRFYEQMAGVEREMPGRVTAAKTAPMEDPFMSVDLRTRYLGLELKNPLVVSACPLTANIDVLRRLEDAGAAAAVMPSLFEEQVVHDQMELFEYYEDPANSSYEAQTYFPELGGYDPGPDNYLRTLEAAKAAVDIPIIGSLNGTSTGGWIRYARMIEQAGADALELNVYLVATDPDACGADVEARYLELVQTVGESIAIPMAVKIGPFFSSLPNMARRLALAGVDGLVLFNRFLQPDIDLETLTVTPHLVLSTSDELRLPLRWIAILRGQLEISLAGTTGVHTSQDVVKLLLAGADATMTASALFKNGPEHVRTLVDGLRSWLDEKEYVSVEQMKGSVSRDNSPDPESFERANYIKTLTTFIGGAIWGMPQRPR